MPETPISIPCLPKCCTAGQPPLWYLVVKAAIACGLPYGCLGLLSGVIATAGAGLFLVKSPFPKPISVILCFSYFLVYQYAVIARSYVLLPLLLFAVATLGRQVGAAHSLGRCPGPAGQRGRTLVPDRLRHHACTRAATRISLAAAEFEGATGQLAAVCLYAAAALPVVLLLWPATDCVAKTGLNGGMRFGELLNGTLYAVDSSAFENTLLTVSVLLLSCYWFWRTSVLGLFLVVCLPVFAFFLTVRPSMSTITAFSSWRGCT